MARESRFGGDMSNRAASADSFDEQPPVHAPLFASDTTARHGHADFARFHFLDPVAADFLVDWEAGARVTVALLHAEAGRHPADPDLRELVGELSTLSPKFRTMWATHDVHDGTRGSDPLRRPAAINWRCRARGRKCSPLRRGAWPCTGRRPRAHRAAGPAQGL
ncbi:hypothetical protein AB5J49_42960 [Streptomyces sp. R28]|uniref:MmyB-like transcription regulator ligand binding domain-containing protein n=1 Tax=Streptomyces sp. R28 TaxID=3238628 RepID=A0AB39QBB2_9ACTN